MKTILIVDDEPMVIRAVARVLRSRGFEVLSAADPIEARAHYAAADVVLSDWNMPNGGGQRVLDESPKPVVIHSALYRGAAGLVPFEWSSHFVNVSPQVPLRIASGSRNVSENAYARELVASRFVRKRAAFFGSRVHRGPMGIQSR